MNVIANFKSNPFIEVELNGETQLGVNARELHEMLEVKSDFSHWIKRRFTQCKFEENFDYIKLVKKDELSTTRQTIVEYIISVDMTKHLGMMERNDKGYEIRKYFIEQEKLVRIANNSIQIEVGKAMEQVKQITNSLSDAARYLNVVGKQVKPALMKHLEGLIEQTQHQLDFDNTNCCKLNSPSTAYMLE